MNTVDPPDGVRAVAPATVANLCCGFDVLGLAIAAPCDEVVARPTAEPGVRISVITGDGGRLPYEPERNTAAVAVQALLAAHAPAAGIELEIHKRLPLGGGLGSSAASAVAAVVAANALLGAPCPRTALLPYALAGEQVASGAVHADNVAPCLLGGITLLRSSVPLDVVSLPVPADLYCTVVHPQLVVATAEARALLPACVPLGAAVAQWGNVGALVASLYREDYALLARALHDAIVEPARAHLIPNFDAVKVAALAAGALGCGISGACPSVFALSRSAAIAQVAGQAMQQAFADADLASECYVSPVNQEGARLL